MYTIFQIAAIVQGEFLHRENDAPVTHLLIDSRKLTLPDSSLFFAIPGDRHDGHDFIPDLIKKGVRNFVVSKAPAADHSAVNIILVPDTLAALQKLAAHHRSRFQYPVLGITGSNGKTIVKEWLYQLLRDDHEVVRSPKSYNSQVGVPLSVWEMKPEHDLGIFEAGISHPGEMKLLGEIIRPTMGIFTNVGQAHAENFVSVNQKVLEKLKLFETASVIIYCKDHTPVHEALAGHETLSSKQFFTWSKRSRADLQIGRIAPAHVGTTIQGIYQNQFISIEIPFSDHASVENAITCWAYMLVAGIPQEVIARRMKDLSPVAMRLELKEGINSCTIINDSYSSDLLSLQIALDFLNQQKQHDKRTLIISDILQSGKSDEVLYREVAEMVKNKGVNRIIGIGPAISAAASGFSGEKMFFSDTAHFLSAFSSLTFRDETILLKGARTFGFEKLVKLMQQKAHETVLEINLNALVNNLNYYRSRLKPGVKIMAMVKAFSYGSGSYEIANVLQFNRVDYLAVAYADEGVELRKAGIKLPIMVMNPEEQSYDLMVQYHLEPEIYSFRVLNLFNDLLIKNSSVQNPIPVHIKLDTGMHRLGFVEENIPELIVRIRNNRKLTVKSLFTHLVASDEKEHDDFTRGQLEKFERMSSQISSHLGYPILRHALNSGGINRHSAAQYDMVRLGIGMYGISSHDYEQVNLQPVGTLKTVISQIKSLSAGETVGYSRKGKVSRPSRIATVPIGYADGYSRRLGNGAGFMLVGGKKAPVVGNVCMDMCMIDVTEIDCQEGDEVIVFGQEPTISEMAKAMGTIPYEVLTNISRRVKRVYYQE